MTERRQEPAIDGIRFGVMENQLLTILAQQTELKLTFEKYVTQHEFAPVKLLAYGFAALMLTAMLSALVASVIAR